MKIEVKEVKPVEPPKEYVITLDQVELDLVTTLLENIGGYDDPYGYRHTLNLIYENLSVYKKNNIRLNPYNGRSHWYTVDKFGNRVAYK